MLFGYIHSCFLFFFAASAVTGKRVLLASLAFVLSLDRCWSGLASEWATLATALLVPRSRGACAHILHLARLISGYRLRIIMSSVDVNTRE